MNNLKVKTAREINSNVIFYYIKIGNIVYLSFDTNIDTLKKGTVIKIPKGFYKTYNHSSINTRGIKDVSGFLNGIIRVYFDEIVVQESFETNTLCHIVWICDN